MKTTKLDITRRCLLAATAAAALTAVLFNPGAATAQETPRRGGVLTIAQVTEPAMLTAAFNPSTYIVLVASKVLEGLVSYDAQQKPQPSLATSWDISPDGLVYTFRLRPGVTCTMASPSRLLMWPSRLPRSGASCIHEAA